MVALLNWLGYINAAYVGVLYWSIEPDLRKEEWGWGGRGKKLGGRRAFSPRKGRGGGEGLRCVMVAIEGILLRKSVGQFKIIFQRSRGNISVVVLVWRSWRLAYWFIFSKRQICITTYVRHTHIKKRCIKIPIYIQKHTHVHACISINAQSYIHK